MEKIPNIPDKKLVKGSNWHLGDVEGDQGDLCDSIIASVMLYETEVYGIPKYQVNFTTLRLM